jgi:hypothetical protein
MKIQRTAILNQNVILAGLTTISLAIVCADRLLPILAKQSSRETEPAIAQNLSQSCQQLPTSQVFVRTDLFFGLGKSNGSEITAAEFQQFLTREITPQFPDGLTLLSGRGQFQDAGGRVVKEPANVLIIIYPLDRSPHHNQKIEQIRNAYKTAFHQESVLRADELTCVSF